MIKIMIAQFFMEKLDKFVAMKGIMLLEKKDSIGIQLCKPRKGSLSVSYQFRKVLQFRCCWKHTKSKF